MSSGILDHDSGGSVASRFHFTREMIAGPIYRKYEKAIRGVWNAKELDYSQDAADWQGIDDAQRRGLLGVTVRFLAGEQAVTDVLEPQDVAAHFLVRSATSIRPAGFGSRICCTRACRSMAIG